MGDVLLAASATRELRRLLPEAKIDFAVRKPYADAARLLPGIDRVLVLEGRGLLDLLRFRARSIHGRVDLFIDLQGNARSRLLGMLLLPGRTARSPRLSFTRRALVRWKRGKGEPYTPVWRRYLAALERAGLPVREEPPRLDGIRPARKTGAVLFAPGAGRATKRWPARSFGEAARAIAEATGRPILLVGSEDERPLLEEVRAAAGPRAEIAAGLPLDEVAARLSGASLLVTNDSGLLHLAGGLGVPVVAVFGPTTPELGFGPAGERSAVVSVDLPCRPCSLHGTEVCPLPDRSHICMVRVGPEEVVRAALRILRDAAEGTG
jgi:heptosyltransferase-2